MQSVSQANMNELPEEPVKPLDSDCCGQGCIPCVFDIYDEEMKIWQRECERIQNGEQTLDIDNIQNKGPLLSPLEYHKFEINSILKETANSFRYKFLLPQGCSLGLKVGQHVIVRGHINGETITRQYTPISDVSATSYFELLIKIYGHGKMSQYVKDWRVGEEVEIRGPYGHLEYRPNKYRRVVMLCVGTGIAPISQLVQHILNNESDETVIDLHYGCRTYTDVLLKSELDDWSRYWNFSVSYYLSQDAKDTNYRYGDTVIHCRINMEILKTALSDTSEILVLICGTRSFEKDIIDCLNTLGLPASKYHKF